MRHGVLWFDDGKNRTLAEKVERAARHYEARYHLKPTVCYVHPSTMLGSAAWIDGIEIKESNVILPNHLWIGVDGRTEGQSEV